jgi:hypothetical protein
VKQFDNLSDIGVNPDGSKGVTRFSGFSQLNGNFENSLYWWKDKMTDFNPETFKYWL